MKRKAQAQREKPLTRAQQRLAEQWRRLACKEGKIAAKRYGFPVDDATGDALLVLVKFCRWWRPSRGVPFAPIFCRCVRQRFRQIAVTLDYQMASRAQTGHDLRYRQARVASGRLPPEVFDRWLSALAGLIPARTVEMVRMRAGGAGLCEIGSRFSLSKERVRQILLRAGELIRAAGVAAPADDLAGV